jgi:hypothetical protein
MDEQYQHGGLQMALFTVFWGFSLKLLQLF